MADNNNSGSGHAFRVRHRGRSAQIAIYLGKNLRIFIYQNDWKVLPMAALIAGLVGMVIRRRFAINMEGTLMGAFAMVCVCIWNGAFNSIQVICRERDVIKREHRSGMHISSYIMAHVIYQAMLCVAQTVVTLYVTGLVGVAYPEKGIFTQWFLVDFGISMFFITFASDMLSLWISCLSRNTTTAMTIMPFVLIFQLVFSGGMLTLPAWTEPLTHFTISNPGLKVICAQADVNNRPFVTISDVLHKMRDNEIKATITVGQILDLAEREDIETIAALRKKPLSDSVTVGELLDEIISDPDVQAERDSGVIFTTTVGTLLDVAGEEEIRTYLEKKAADASYKEEYELSRGRVAEYWMHLIGFTVLFAALAVITLEFIDKDKR